MRKLFRRRPSPAMVVACLALLVALGGTSVAAVSQLVPRNSVGPLQIRNGAVTNPKIRNNAVTSAKVRNRSLLRSDFAPGQLPAGPTGPQGPAGPAGAAGPAGPRGTVGTVTVRTQSTTIADAVDNNEVYGTAEIQALCASGELAISGGATWSDSNPGLELFVGRLTPVLNATNQVTGFLASGLNDTGQTSTFTVSSLCYTP
jgi:hypothetical protein